MFIDILMLLGGVFALWFSADWLVEGASKIAADFNIKPIVIGLTIVAFGTSAPELIVSLAAAFDGKPAIALGNVIGSNVANIALVLAICALIKPIHIDAKAVKTDIPFMVAVSFITYLLARMGQKLVFWDGIILLACLAYFLIRTFAKAKNGEEELDEETAELVKPDKGHMGKHIIELTAGFIGLVIGANLLVNGASSIAEAMGVSKMFISLSLVAFGTSLPELAASSMAAWRGKSDICLGNIIGSNIFNLVLVLGATVAVKGFLVERIWLQRELVWMVGIAVLLYFMCRTSKILGRIHGAVLLSLYFGFLYHTFMA